MKDHDPLSAGMTAPQIETVPFRGFENLTANFIYCPNQFFDVCLPHSSRGTVRLVAYLLKRTLGWLDTGGNPVKQEISASYREIMSEAGISRGAIREAIDEAIASEFIHCIQPGRANSGNEAARRGSFGLRWDTRNTYARDRNSFEGFFVGEGHRTPIPNAFFERVVPQEPLAVVKIVGTVLRHTVGYQNQFGGRRSEAPLSYTYIQRYAAMADRSTLSQAIRHALDIGYICRVDEGAFGSWSTERKAASYAVRWLNEAELAESSSKTRPDAGEQFKKPTSTLGTVQKPDQSRSTNPTNNGPESRPAEQFRNPTTVKTSAKTLLKQQQETIAVAAEFSKGFQLLRTAGFDEKTAVRLAHLASAEEIQQQLIWLDRRNSNQNRLGMLRKAIEERWTEPTAPVLAESSVRHAGVYAGLDAVTEEREQKKKLRVAKLAAWAALSARQKTEFYDLAVAQATSEYTRSRLRRAGSLDNPPSEVLALVPLAEQPIEDLVPTLSHPL